MNKNTATLAEQEEFNEDKRRRDEMHKENETTLKKMHRTSEWLGDRHTDQYATKTRGKKFISEDLEIKVNPTYMKIERTLFNKGIKLGQDIYDRTIIKSLEDTISLYHTEVKLVVTPNIAILDGTKAYDPIKIKPFNKLHKIRPETNDKTKDLNYKVDKLINNLYTAYHSYEKAEQSIENLDDKLRFVQSDKEQTEILNNIRVTENTCEYLVDSCKKMNQELIDIRGYILKTNAVIDAHRGYFAKKKQYINASDISSPTDRITYKWDKFAETVLRKIDARIVNEETDTERMNFIKDKYMSQLGGKLTYIVV